MQASFTRFAIVLCVLISGGLSWVAAAMSFAQPATQPATAPAVKWAVTHQLVHGVPWPSESWPEAQIRDRVKEYQSTGDQRLVNAMNDLAGWYRGKKNYAEAEKIYKDVLELQAGRMGVDHHDVALSRNDLGVVYAESDRPREAEEQFKRALEIWRKSWEMELRTEDEAVTMHNYAALLEKTGRSGEAKTFEDKARAIMEARKKAFGL